MPIVNRWAPVHHHPPGASFAGITYIFLLSDPAGYQRRRERRPCWQSENARVPAQKWASNARRLVQSTISAAIEEAGSRYLLQLR